MKKIFSIALLALLPVVVHASDNGKAVERPVVSAYTIEAGTSHIAETYLSPLHYSGTALALSYERMQAMRFDPHRWVMRLSGRLDGARTHNNPAHNATMWDLNLRLAWSMTRRWTLDSWSIYAGGYTSLEGGVLYLSRNSNNPVAANGNWELGLSAAVACRTSLFGKNVTLRYLAELPLTGIFFMPQYGELYYEIYLGNRKGLVHGAWPGNYFRLNNLLTADIALGRTILRLGYRCDIASVKANDIVHRKISHTAILGIASEWISLSPTHRPDPDAVYISALY